MPTKTEIVKAIVSLAVGLKTARIMKQQIDMHTSINADNIVVDAGCLVGGQLVAMKTKPYTDNAVDFAVEKFETWNSSRSN